jgi:hypothetical protein
MDVQNLDEGFFERSESLLRLEHMGHVGLEYGVMVIWGKSARIPLRGDEFGNGTGGPLDSQYFQSRKRK